jgi:hypothetical protein
MQYYTICKYIIVQCFFSKTAAKFYLLASASSATVFGGEQRKTIILRVPPERFFYKIVCHAMAKIHFGFPGAGGKPSPIAVFDLPSASQKRLNHSR